MPESQAIVEHPTAAAVFLVLTIAPPGGEATVRDVLSDVGGLRRSVGFRMPEARLSCVVGIGSDAFDRLYGAPRSRELHRLPRFEGPRHHAPSTPGDVFLHIRAERMDMCFELAQRLTEALGAAAETIDEVHGFRSFDDRDLLGFVDGTENPEGQGAIGRTKLSNLEFADEDKPPNAHIALNVIEDAAGEEVDVMRANMPFGSVGTREFGTYYVSYAKSPWVMEQMLSHMFCGSADAAHDRILDFSTALTGNLFFVPTLDLLEDPPAPAPAPPDAPGSPAADPSLGIGGRRGGHP